MKVSNFKFHLRSSSHPLPSSHTELPLGPQRGHALFPLIGSQVQRVGLIKCLSSSCASTTGQSETPPLFYYLSFSCPIPTLVLPLPWCPLKHRWYMSSNMQVSLRICDVAMCVFLIYINAINIIFLAFFPQHYILRSNLYGYATVPSNSRIVCYSRHPPCLTCPFPWHWRPRLPLNSPQQTAGPLVMQENLTKSSACCISLSLFSDKRQMPNSCLFKHKDKSVDLLSRRKLWKEGWHLWTLLMCRSLLSGNKIAFPEPCQKLPLTFHWEDMGRTATLVGEGSGNTSIRLLSSISLVRGSKGERGKNWLLGDPTQCPPHEIEKLGSLVAFWRL